MEINIINGRFIIRQVKPGDNAALKEIIVNSLLEFGASGDGFACNDSETQSMYEAYQSPGRIYFTLLYACSEECSSCDNCKIVGGAGVAPLPDEDSTCEFVKMYYLPEMRGLGLGKIMLELCIEEAKKLGYKKMYLETLTNMHAARGLYEKFGFKQIESPKGCTGHDGCDAFYMRSLVASR